MDTQIIAPALLEKGQTFMNLYFNTTSMFNEWGKNGYLDKINATIENIEIYPEKNTQIYADLQNTIKEKKLCKDIDKYKIDGILGKTTILLVVYTWNNQKMVILGFTCLTLRNFVKSIFINLICSNNENTLKGVGTYILDTVKTIAEIIKYTSVELESVPNATTFYLKNGFFINDTNEDISMKYIIQRHIHAGLSSKRKYKNTRRKKSKRKQSHLRFTYRRRRHVHCKKQNLN